MVRRKALLVLDLILDAINGVAGLDLECEGLAREGFQEDLHILLFVVVLKDEVSF